jgi:hypothetical protein
MRKYYKIVDIDSQGNYKTLFHGVNGTRKLPHGVWIKAEIKEDVRDGSRKNATPYKSGFHVMPSREIAETFFHKRFKNKKYRKVVECFVKGKIWKKVHSPSEIYLCEQIMIP